MELQNKIITLQEKIINLQEEEINNYNQRIKEAIDDFNNIPSCEELYQKNLNEKVDIHKYRVKKYNQFIFKHGMQEFTNVLLKAHEDETCLQNFYEFIDFCDENMKEKIQQEFQKREFEMMKSVYMDFMPYLNPEKVVTHMVYLDEDFGTVLDKLDTLIE